MDAVINVANRARLNAIRNELFNMANSYAGDKHGHIACRLHGISNSVYNIRDIMEVLYPSEGIPVEDQLNKPDKVKPLAQYLFEHDCEYADIRSSCEYFQQALDAYESTEQVKIRIEQV